MYYIKSIALILIIGTVIYTVTGVPTRVETIKQIAPNEIEKRKWEILRYEGYQYGSWSRHGGKVWYHVKDTSIPNTYYRVFVTLWGDELHFHYDGPEELKRIDVDIK